MNATATAPNGSIGNDPSSRHHVGNDIGGGSGVTSNSSKDAETVPRPKRIACVLCRKRKLRCDGQRPSCATCSRLGHDCTYDEVRRKSGPKRGYVKALEARLAQVETLLKDQNAVLEENQHSQAGSPGRGGLPAFQQTGRHTLKGVSPQNSMKFPPMPEEPRAKDYIRTDIFATTSALKINTSDAAYANWHMVSKGVEESLPPQQVIDELYDIYFKKIHPALPIIHRGRHFADLGLAPSLRPKIGLRYAMWTIASSVSEKHLHMQAHLYRLARKYLEDAELQGFGEGTIALGMSQAWSLLACYEFKLMMFPRAWMSTGRAVRLAQMKGLHVLDGQNLEVKQCLQPSRDWIDKEERRRTFWSAFCLDRYASMGTGWPTSIDERDVMTNLPATDESFENNIETRTLTVNEALTPEGAATLTPFGGVALMAVLFGRNLTHLHRPDTDNKDGSFLEGEFWRRHRVLDNILSGIGLALPMHFRLPGGVDDVNVVFTNMNIHTSTICLHQAAIFKADKTGMPQDLVSGSKIRCITAAAEITNIVRMISHTDLSKLNPFVSFCLYVAARVFIQYLKSRPTDEQVKASLEFLISCMKRIKKLNPLAESFLVQLDMDMNGGVPPEMAFQPQDPSDNSPTAATPGSTSRRVVDADLLRGIAQVRQTQKGTCTVFPGGADQPLTIHSVAQFYSDSPDSNNQHGSPDSFGGTDSVTPPSQPDHGAYQQHTPPSQSDGGSYANHTPPTQSENGSYARQTPPRQPEPGRYVQQEPPNYFDPGVLMDDGMSFQHGVMGEKEWGFFDMETGGAGGVYEQDLGPMGGADGEPLLMPSGMGMQQGFGHYFTGV